MVYWVYVIHFDRKLHHAQHYCGVTTNVRERMERHLNGRGARIVEAAQEAGINFELGGLFCYETDETHDKTMRGVEALLKKQKNTARYCEKCSGSNVKAIPGTLPVSIQSAYQWFCRGKK